MATTPTPTEETDQAALTAKTIIPESYIRLGILMHTAIAGVSIAAVIQLASRERLDQILTLSILCFAIAIPTAVAMVFISRLLYPRGEETIQASRMYKQSWPLFTYVIAIAEQAAFFGGFLLLFWSLHQIAGWVFLFSSLLAFITVSQVEKKLKQP